MKLIFTLFAIILDIRIATCAAQSPIGLVKNKPDVNIENFETLDSLYKEKIKSQINGTFTKFNQKFDKAYDDYAIINACKGSFIPKRNYGYSMTIVNKKNKTAAYIVAVASDKGWDFFELQKFDIDFSERGYIRGRAGENICLSSKEAKKIKNDYSKGSSEDGRFTNLEPQTVLDITCGTPEGGDMEFICFEYDKARRQFRNIGGWQNE